MKMDLVLKKTKMVDISLNQTKPNQMKLILTL